MKDIRLKRFRRLSISTSRKIIGISFNESWSAVTGYKKVISVDFVFIHIWYYYQPVKTSTSRSGGKITFY